MKDLVRGIEIERKFVIEKPDFGALSRLDGYTASEIEQIYLTSPDGTTHRIRRRTTSGTVRYYETVKRRLDAMSAIEDEGEITPDRYAQLKAEIAEGTRPIKKVRHTFPFGAHTVEIDVYPEWERTAILEVELPSRDAELSLPTFIRVIKEVTGIKAYSNASLSRSFPDEP